MQAGLAFSDTSVWKESIEMIKKEGGYTPQFVSKAVEDGFNLFDSYVFQRSKRKILFHGLQFNSFEALVEVFRAKSEQERNYLAVCSTILSIYFCA